MSVITKRRSSKKGTARTVGLVRGKRSRHAASKPEKPASAPIVEPVERTFRGMVHDAIDGVDAVRRALCNLHVALVRKNTDAAALEHVLVFEELERVYGQLVQLDLTLPEGGAS